MSSISLSTPVVSDTRSRILQSAVLLFRQHGYHGVSVNDILEAAQAPKGSLYHHFPGGKAELAVAVTESITDALFAMVDSDHSVSTASLVRSVGHRILEWMRATSSANEAGCAVLACLAAESEATPIVGAAVRRAYQRLGRLIAERLERENWPPRAAEDSAFLVIAILEGGGLVSRSLGEPRLYTAAVERAAGLLQGSRVSA
jgi:TetR/AcrR family transcriptional regulator, lmrAB and yxaGH operons repressor